MASNLSSWKRTHTARVLGHRGARHAAPENTLLAFERALEEGAAGVELDVRLGARGLVLVLHDADLKRVTQGRDGRHAESLDREALTQVDAGCGERVPTLLEVLDWAKQRGALLNIELKGDVSDPRALVWGVVSAVTALHTDPSQILFSSFELRLLRALAKAAPHVPRGFLFDEAWRGILPLAEAVKAVAAHPRCSLITPRRVRAWRRRGLLVNTWTVNDPSQARQLDALGVDTLISDTPGTVLAALRAPT